MSKEKADIENGRIGNGSGLINPNSEDFRLLQEKILAHSAEISNEEKIQNLIRGLKYRMESYLTDRSSEKLIPVGNFLKEFVEIIKVPHKDFAAYIGLKNPNLSAIYKGTRRINHDIAMKLGHIFDMDPALWLHIQNKVELQEIRSKGEKDYQQYQLNDLLKKVG